MFSGVTFLLGVMILSTGLLADIVEVYDKQIPSLVLASENFPIVDSIFSVLLLAGMIYTKYIKKEKIIKDEQTANQAMSVYIGNPRFFRIKTRNHKEIRAAYIF